MKEDKRLLFFNARYRLEKLIDKSGWRELLKVILIGKNRLWVCDGVGMVSIYVNTIPDEAVGTVLMPEQIVYARKAAREAKMKTLSFKYGLMSVNTKDEEVPFLQYVDGHMDEIRDYKKKDIIKQINMYSMMIREISKLQQQFHYRVVLSFSNIMNVLSAMGGDTKHNFEFSYYFKEEKRALLIRTITANYYNEEEETINAVKRNVGLIMPMGKD